MSNSALFWDLAGYTAYHVLVVTSSLLLEKLESRNQ